MLLVRHFPRTWSCAVPRGYSDPSSQVVLYSLPELDGAIDTVVLGGLVGDTIGIVPERVRKMNERIKGWVTLRRTPARDRKVAVLVYGFPPNVGAVSQRGEDWDILWEAVGGGAGVVDFWAVGWLELVCILLMCCCC